MKSWNEFSSEEFELAEVGKKLLFPSRPHAGFAYLATLRKDGAPRLHPVSPVFSNGHLYVLIPPTSPKCADLISDGRYAMQAFPSPHSEGNEEFYLAGRAICIENPAIRQKIIDDTRIHVVENEVLFELLLDRAMYTKLVNRGTPNERPIHRKWRATE